MDPVTGALLAAVVTQTGAGVVAWISHRKTKNAVCETKESAERVEQSIGQSNGHGTVVHMVTEIYKWTGQHEERHRGLEATVARLAAAHDKEKQ